jgi:hypothetical protein
MVVTVGRVISHFYFVPNSSWTKRVSK